MRAIFGGNRCLAGDTVIHDPEYGERRIDQIDGSFKVLAWDGDRLKPVRANKPYKKEVDDLYDITLSNGNKFTCSLTHCVLTPYGYRTIFDVAFAYGGVLLGSSSVSSQKVQSSDGQNYGGITEGFLSGYSAYSYLYDEQPLLEIDSDPNVVPLQGDEEARISFLASLRRGDLVSKEGCIRACQLSCRLSNQDDLRRYVDQFVDTESDVSYKPYISTSEKHLIGHQPTVGYDPQQSTAVSVLLDKTSYSTTPSDTSLLVITSIAYNRRDVKWDFEVPIYHNYYLGGAIHHNSGKTTAGCLEFLMHMTQQYPDWYPKENRVDKPIKGRIIATDFGKGVGEVIIPTIEQWIDTTVGGTFVDQRIRNPIGIATKWILKNGSQFDILTHEQSTEQFEGWSGDLCWFDEPPPRDKYIATRRGLVDNNGKTMLTLTPLKQPWVYDEIYTNDDPQYFCVTMDITDNPTLNRASINEFANSLTDEEKEARLHGRFKHLSGLVFKEFDQDIHIWDNPKVQKHWTTYFAIDPHPRTPTACLWVSVDEQDQLYIVDEMWLPEMTVSEIANAIKMQELEHPSKFKFIDPAMDKDNELAGGFNVRRELMKNGIACARANNDFDYGIGQIRQALRPRLIPLLSCSIPRLRIARHCKHTIYEFQHYIWDEYQMRPEDHDEKQKVKKKDDHFIDCLRYILNANPRYFRADDDGDDEVEWAGQYTKYPTNTMKHRTTGSSKYYDLVDTRESV